jgi:hypothetical protein
MKKVATKRYLMNLLDKWIESRKLENYFVPSDEGWKASLKMVTSAWKEELEREKMKSALVHSAHLSGHGNADVTGAEKGGERDRCGNVGRV